MGRKIVLGVSGASGAIYAKRLLDRLVASQDVERVALIVSPTAWQIAQSEGQELPTDSGKIELFRHDVFFASPASGSAHWDSMAILPCSVGCIGRVACGVSTNLIERAADVMLKERRTLVVVVREMPLSTIHLRNMASLSESGAVVMTACPSFYFNPVSVEDVVDTVVERVLGQLGIESGAREFDARKN